MKASSSDLADLCLAELVQDVAGDSVTIHEVISAAWLDVAVACRNGSQCLVAAGSGFLAPSKDGAAGGTVSI